MPITHGGVILPPDSTGKSVDLAQLPSLRWREVDCLGSPTVDDAVIEPTTTNVTPAGTYALPVINARAGNTSSHVILTASTNASMVKSTPGILYDLEIYNDTSAKFFVKLFDKASAPTLGTDPVKRVIGVQAGTRQTWTSNNGLTFAVGIAFAVTLNIANNDTAALVGATVGAVDMGYT